MYMYAAIIVMLLFMAVNTCIMYAYLICQAPLLYCSSPERVCGIKGKLAVIAEKMVNPWIMSRTEP